MHDICEETKAFVLACETIHARLACKPLTHDDRDLIESSCLGLMCKLRPAFRMAKRVKDC